MAAEVYPDPVLTIRALDCNSTRKGGKVERLRGWRERGRERERQQRRCSTDRRVKKEDEEEKEAADRTEAFDRS